MSWRECYLPQGMRPDVSAAIMRERPPKSKVRFGPRVAGRVTTSDGWSLTRCCPSIPATWRR